VVIPIRITTGICFIFRQLFLTNKQLGNNTTIVNYLTAKFPAIWIAQSKDMFLPQFMYKLCKEYMNNHHLVVYIYIYIYILKFLVYETQTVLNTI
jgi:hypothetical protein